MLTIDGKPVSSQGSILDACRAAHVDVPTLCFDPRIAAGGHCRACLVEIDGRFVAACSTPARDGMRVRTDTEALREYRRDLGELVLSECAPGGDAARVIAGWGADGSRYTASARPAPRADESHPYLRFQLDACILCRQCVRVCEELQGQFVYSVLGRGAESRLTWGEGPFAETGCVSCGACASVCPTGAISDIDRLRRPPAESHVRTTCGYCGVGCQLDVGIAQGAISHIDGAAASVNNGHLCVKGRYAHAFVDHPDRLRTAYIRRHGRLEPASVAEALDVVAAEFKRLRGSIAGLSSSRCTNEENYLFQKLMRGALGTNHVDCCARVCHAPSAAGMRTVLGTGAATNDYASLEKADLILVFGANPTEAHPVIGARIKQAVLRGARLIVVDPRRTELAAMADFHLQLRPGTNVPLLNSLAAVLVEEGLVDQAFLQARVDGFDRFSTFIAEHRPERWEATTQVPASLVREAARHYAQATNAMMVHGLGVTEHCQGSEAVELLCNLALLCGDIGRPGVGINPLRGQNNVQGAADMGCQPDFTTGYQSVRDPQVRQRFEQVWGRQLPREPGLRLPEMFEAARRGEIKGLFILGEDVLQTDPDSHATRKALASLEFLVVQELFLTETARAAHVVLPGASFLEKDGTFTNAERRIQRVRRVVDPPRGAHADGELLLALLDRLGWAQTLRGPADVMAEVARVVPAFAGVSYARLEGDGLQWPVPSAESTGTSILHVGSFAAGPAPLMCVPFEPSPELRDGITLTTGRVLQHYNSGSMTRRTPNAELVDQDLLEIHPEDAAALGITDGALTVVSSVRGEARLRARLSDRVRPGTVFTSFHFPETGTNAVTSDVKDRISGCPEYKVTAVDVRLAGPA